MPKQNYESAISKFKTKKWPWVAAGIFVLAAFGIAYNGVANTNGEQKTGTEIVKAHEKAAEEKLEEAKNLQEQAKKEIKEAAKEENNYHRGAAGPNARVEGLRLKYFWQRWEAGTHTSSFSEYCKTSGASWACQARNVRSFDKEEFDVYTNVAKGRSNTAEHAEAEDFADHMIEELCTLLRDDAKTLRDTSITIRDRFGDDIEDEECGDVYRIKSIL